MKADRKETSKPGATKSTSRLGGFLHSVRRKALRPLIILGMLAGLAFGSCAVWQKVQQQVIADPDYRIDPHAIEITPQPHWIRSDIKAEVIRDASLGSSLSILDRDLSLRIAQAFALHPWVRKVERVSKRPPARLEVALSYREPVAMVEVPGGLFAVDVEGVVLPSDDFSPLEARDYPRITGVKSSPRGPIGTNWGDAAVSGGAHLAVALSSVWREFSLKGIAVEVTGATNNELQPTFSLLTKGNVAIPWGRAPGSEKTGEQAAEEKIARLKRHIREHGSLDEDAERHSIDLISVPR